MTTKKTTTQTRAGWLTFMLGMSLIGSAGGVLAAGGSSAFLTAMVCFMAAGGMVAWSMHLDGVGFGGLAHQEPETDWTGEPLPHGVHGLREAMAAAETTEPPDFEWSKPLPSLVRGMATRLKAAEADLVRLNDLVNHDARRIDALEQRSIELKEQLEALRTGQVGTVKTVPLAQPLADAADGVPVADDHASALASREAAKRDWENVRRDWLGP